MRDELDGRQLMRLKQEDLIERDLHPLRVLLPDAERDLATGRLFITGGTGFVGKWLLESIGFFARSLGCVLPATVLTRSARRFTDAHPRLAATPGLVLHQGDVRSFSFPEGKFDIVIHGATESSASLNAEAPLAMLDTIIAGTRRVLDFAAQARTRKLLLISSGAVYGRQPPDLECIPEDYAGGPDPLAAGSAYGEGKRVAEQLGMRYASARAYEVKIARCFAFVGPYLPLDIHFAAGNFIGDALAGRCIRVQGDGRTIRSYLYTADMVLWLWKLLFNGGDSRAYNVGSELPIDIAGLARIVRDVSGAGIEVEILGASDPGASVHRYVPCTARARDELGLVQTVLLTEAIRRTIEWHRAVAA